MPSFIVLVKLQEGNDSKKISLAFHQLGTSRARKPEVKDGKMMICGSALTNDRRE